MGLQAPSIAAIALLLLLGCSPSARVDDPPREEVVFWHFWGGEDRPVVDGIVLRFNESQDRYRVRAIAMPGNNLDLKFFLGVAGGDPPDLVNQDDPILADWASRGALTPLDELVDADELAALSQWLFPVARQLSSYDDRLYALPNGLDIRALYYNATWLEELGIDPPATIDELDRLAEAVAPRGGGALKQVGYLPDPRRLWAWGVVFGGGFWNPEAATPDEAITLDCAENLAALKWMAAYRDRYGADRMASFRTGDQALTGSSFPLLAGRRYAAIMDGQWRVRDLAKAAAETPSQGERQDRYSVAPLPTPPGGRSDAGWVNGNFFLVPRGARQADGAWEFMKFWSGFNGNETGAAEACVAGGWMPVSQRVVDEPVFQAMLTRRPLFGEFVRLAASPNQQPTPPLPVASFYYREVNAAVQDVLYRGADAEQRLREAAERVRDQLRPVWEREREAAR
ncbi:MAG: extracellular solute-binding protein [Planctomycetota bacterium]